MAAPTLRSTFMQTEYLLEEMSVVCKEGPRKDEFQCLRDKLQNMLNNYFDVNVECEAESIRAIILLSKCKDREAILLAINECDKISQSLGKKINSIVEESKKCIKKSIEMMGLFSLTEAHLLTDIKDREGEGDGALDVLSREASKAIQLQFRLNTAFQNHKVFWSYNLLHCTQLEDDGKYLIGLVANGAVQEGAMCLQKKWLDFAKTHGSVKEAPINPEISTLDGFLKKNSFWRNKLTTYC